MSHCKVPVPGFGPERSPLCLVGEAPGLNESIYKRPFVGEAGEELTRMLADAGIDRKSCYVTNIFKHQPPDNDVSYFFIKRGTNDNSCPDLPSYKGGRLRLEFRPTFDDLNRELVEHGAKVVIALGATALWGLLGQAKIASFVGTAHPPTTARPYWVVPTFHPATVLRQWSYRPTVVANFKKALEVLERCGTGPLIRASSRPEFDIKINPTIDQVEVFAQSAVDSPIMAVDIETQWGQIRTISFSLDENSAFVIPFWEPPGPSYWSSLALEVRAWNAVRLVLSGPGTKIFHNGAYDIQYLWRTHGIPVKGVIEDTMVAYHALEPELPKGLGDLAAVFLDMPEWKTSRERSFKDED